MAHAHAFVGAPKRRDRTRDPNRTLRKRDTP
jgi:hypothetical protein